ncbi:MAG: hypothetical protein RBS43_08200, partial [Candidatus Cloacimonas sp.]|nr:hypothetical protein [Candidatus Cloacimonas sp.]
MKRILFASVSLWLFFSAALHAQYQGLDFYLYSSERVRSVENSLQYRLFPFSNASFQINGQSSVDDRLSFNQESKRILLNLGLNITQLHILHSFSSDYQSLFDASDLEPSPYVNKTAMLGYQFSYLPLDSLSLSMFSKGIFRQEQDRYISGNHLASKGYWLGSNARFSSSLGNANGGISVAAERKKLAWEAYDLAQLDSNFSLSGQDLAWDSNFNLNNHHEEIYTLNSPTASYHSSYYSLTDSQDRHNLSAHSAMQYSPGQRVQISLAEDYSQKRTSYSSTNVRNNADFLNQAQLKLSVELPHNLALDSDASHSYAIKDFNYNLNTRHTENRHVGTKLS